jgi:hypothetical protein
MKNDKRRYLWQEILVYFMFVGFLFGIFGCIYSLCIKQLIISSIFCSITTATVLIQIYHLVNSNLSLFRFFRWFFQKQV